MSRASLLHRRAFASFGTKHVPTELRLRTAERRLDVAFGPNERYSLPAELLRVYSPSADVRQHDGTWSIPPHRRGVAIIQMEPVGNYAVRYVERACERALVSTDTTKGCFSTTCTRLVSTRSTCCTN